MTPDHSPDQEEATSDCRQMIGWKEYLDFPEWNLRHVRVKVDTGARTSALDALRCELQPNGDGWIARVELALHRRRPRRRRILELPVVRLVVVTSSNGWSEKRPVIETTMHLGSVRKRIELTVTSRSNMSVPVLLGREALAGSFVVDVSRKYVLRNK